jgi:hypothetical protein
MTRREVIRHVVLQARSNGFDIRAWYRAYVEPEWPGLDAAIDHLCQGRNCYVLLFSHEFAQAFWKAGLQMSFMVPAVSYPQRRKDGQVVMVHRRAFARRMLKADSWLYHLREMVEASHPLKYIRRFVVLQEDIIAAQRRGSSAKDGPLAAIPDEGLSRSSVLEQKDAVPDAEPDPSRNAPEPIRQEAPAKSDRLIS